MAETMSDVLSYSELELTVRTLMPSKIEDLGTLGWYQAHERMQKLSQQAIVEVHTDREENVIGLLASNDKVSVLVHEAICIQVWREKVLPEILSSCLDESAHGFMPYLIMFHEAVAVSVLETVLFSAEACAALGDSVLDLVDYAAFNLALLVSDPVPVPVQEPVRERGTREQLEQQQKTLGFSVGIRCLAIVRYLATNMDRLSVGATTRMLDTHDLPVVLAALMECRPWVRLDSRTGRNMVFQDEEWREEGQGGQGLPRAEKQLWLSLHQLLLSPAAPPYLPTGARRANLAKLQRFLVDSVLDQLSPLVQLKHWLCQLSVSTPSEPGRPQPLLEMLPQMRPALLGGRKPGKWKALALEQSRRMFGTQLMQQVAQGMAETYDLELLEKLQPTMRRCSSCGAETSQRCSRCKTFYYCSRSCQVRDWSKHKSHCDKIVKSACGDHR